jgi:hypothetical protein
MLENQVGDQTCQGYEQFIGCNTKYETNWDKLKAIAKKKVGVF